MIHILVVDDEPSIRETLAGILEDEGYRVTPAEDGESGLVLLRDQHFDVVLLDIWLPQMDGLAVLQAGEGSGGPARGGDDLRTRHGGDRSAGDQTGSLRLSGKTAVAGQDPDRGEERRRGAAAALGEPGAEAAGFARRNRGQQHSDEGACGSRSG